ncbi:MAG: hypothetical protein MI807_06595 [Verrucomicrobiales bacterium]|nr:hypothetical protein [Verrucomicrobiales bacterium]
MASDSPETPYHDDVSYLKVGDKLGVEKATVRITRVPHLSKRFGEENFEITYSDPEYDFVGRNESVEFHGDHFTSSRFPGEKLYPIGAPYKA